MKIQRSSRKAAFFIGLFLLVMTISACNPSTSRSTQGGDSTMGEQSLIDVPGGIMVLPDSVGDQHPVLLYDYQIQSRLVTHTEYTECVEGGTCEPYEGSEDDSGPAGVNWYQAQAYCEYIGGRLPTEAELYKLTRTDESCPNAEYRMGSLDGYGEWVYDWDHPDYYSQSLVTNPFGPLYGDLKLVLEMDLDLLSQYSDKYKIKIEDTYIKLKTGDAEYKLKIDIGDLKLKTDDGDYKLKSGDEEFKSMGAEGSGAYIPRLGMLPENFNPLVGFRCVTQGSTLAYAPICKTDYEVHCTVPEDQLQPLSEIAPEESIIPNFNIIAASCPADERVDITIEHDLPSSEGVEVNDSLSQCECETYITFPGRLFCNCTSPGEGNFLNVNVCDTNSQIPISINDFCPEGYTFDIQNLMCTADPQAPVSLLSMDIDTGGYGDLGCPDSTENPWLGIEFHDLSEDMVGELSELPLPPGDDWSLLSVSDGTGLCMPGYYFNTDTNCCSPLSESNYDCDEGQYFDAGLKQCLSLNPNGCGPCQVYDPVRGCVPSPNLGFLSQRCNVDDEDVTYDDYGRPNGGSGGCVATAYFDDTLGRCVETRDGCPLGFYLDPKTQTCLPLSGPSSPCPVGSALHPVRGCCVPVPGQDGSECPEGTEYNGLGCSPGIDGCPPSHYYDPESDSCLLREGGECPSGTSASLMGKCIADEAGVCPEDFEYDPEEHTCHSSRSDKPLCVEGQAFNPGLGYCEPSQISPGPGGGSGRVECQDLDMTERISRETPDLHQHCANPRLDLKPFDSPMMDTEGSYQCLMFTGDKSFQDGRGLCRPFPSGDGDEERYFTIEFAEGRIASITRVSPDTIDPASANAPPGDPTEIISEIFFSPIGCDLLQISIPPCVRAPAGGSGPKCGGITIPIDCNNTPGCHWDFNLTKCVAD